MPYFVAWIRDGRVRRFAYPHVDLETALAFASEVLDMDCSDVWISDENGKKVADRRAVAQYAEEAEDNELNALKTVLAGKTATIGKRWR